MQKIGKGIWTILIAGGVLAAIINFILPKIWPSNEAPVAEIRSDKMEGHAPLEVTFDGSSSKDPEGKDLRLEWFVADKKASDREKFSRVFTDPDSYHVKLVVTDHGALTDTDSVFIKVLEPQEQELWAPQSRKATTEEAETAADTAPKGWTITVNNGEHIQLIPGKRITVQFGEKRKETYLALNDEVAAVEQILESGETSYFEIDKNGRVIDRQLPHPLSEYSVNINKNSILRESKTELSDGFILYSYKFKWGDRAELVYDSNNKLRNFYANKHRYDHKAKIIYIGREEGA